MTSDPAHAEVLAHLDAIGARYEVMACDPALADTAAFCGAYAPTTGLLTPPSLFQYTMPLRPTPPARVMAVRPATWVALVRKAAPFAPAPM